MGVEPFVAETCCKAAFLPGEQIGSKHLLPLSIMSPSFSRYVAALSVYNIHNNL